MNGMDVPNPVYRDRDQEEEGREMNAQFDLEDHDHFANPTYDPRLYQAESTDVLLPKESDQENNIIEGNGNLRIYRKKDKNKPKGKGVKKWTVLKGAFIWLCKIQSSARRQRDRAVIFLLQYEQEHLDYCQRVMCVCVHVHYSGTCVLQCVDCCFIGCELSSGNLISMLCIPLEFLLFFFVISL